jgi:hypothetical protein
MAQAPMASQTSTKVKIENTDAIVQNSEIPSSNGDEAGAAGGVVSGGIMDKAVFKMGSMKVKAEGKGVCYQTAMVSQNGANANMPAGAQLVPSQVKVMIAM